MCSQSFKVQYSKLPFISPGLTHFREVFWRVYERRDLNLRELTTGINEKRFEAS